MTQKIIEGIKVRDGKPIYVVATETEGNDGRQNRMQLYIRNGDVYFESSGYGWGDNLIFDVSDEAHAMAKEMFVSSVHTAIKNRLLELRQLDVLLSDLGMKDLIRETLTIGATKMLQGIPSVASEAK